MGGLADLEPWIADWRMASGLANELTTLLAIYWIGFGWNGMGWKERWISKRVIGVCICNGGRSKWDLDCM